MEGREVREMKGERQFVKVYNDFMNEYEPKEKLTYLVIKTLINVNIGNLSIVCVESLLTVLGMKINTPNKRVICESMQKLSDNNIIKVFTDMKCNNLITEIDKNKTYFIKVVDEGYSGGYFAKIYYDDIKKMFSIEQDFNSTAKIYTVYFNIISRIFDSISSDKYTLPTVDEIEEETGINRKSISKYTSILYDNELLFKETGRISRDRIKNYYCRWEDRELLINMLKIRGEI